MPVRRYDVSERRSGDSRYDSLKKRLIAEWRGSPSRGTRVATPDIAEEVDRQQRIINVIVTWDEWADLDAQTRSEMIVEAFQAVKGEDAVLDLTIAMGLTKAEATRLGRLGEPANVK